MLTNKNDKEHEEYWNPRKDLALIIDKKGPDGRQSERSERFVLKLTEISTEGNVTEPGLSNLSKQVFICSEAGLINVSNTL